MLNGELVLPRCCRGKVFSDLNPPLAYYLSIMFANVVAKSGEQIFYGGIIGLDCAPQVDDGSEPVTPSVPRQLSSSTTLQMRKDRSGAVWPLVPQYPERCLFTRSVRTIG